MWNQGIEALRDMRRDFQRIVDTSSDPLIREEARRQVEAISKQLGETGPITHQPFRRT